MKKKNLKIYRKGDILLIKYKYDPVGWIIRKWTKSNFNHVVWVIDENQILESNRHGVIISSINKYNNFFLYSYEVVKLENISTYRLYKAIDIACSFIRPKSYINQLLTFILLLFNYKGDLPIDTCSGLIAQALDMVKFRFNSKRPSRITPQDIYESEYTRQI